MPPPVSGLSLDRVPASGRARLATERFGIIKKEKDDRIPARRARLVHDRFGIKNDVKHKIYRDNFIAETLTFECDRSLLSVIGLFRV